MPGKLSDALGQLVPKYCVPEIFIRLDEIPINAVSGKYDFKALPAPDRKLEQHIDLDDYVGKDKIIALWASLLNVPFEAVDPDRTFGDNGATGEGELEKSV